MVQRTLPPDGCGSLLGSCTAAVPLPPWALTGNWHLHAQIQIALMYQLRGLAGVTQILGHFEDER